MAGLQTPNTVPCTKFVITLLKLYPSTRAVYTHRHHCPALVHGTPWPASCVWLAPWESLKPESEAPHYFLGTGITRETGLPKWLHLSVVNRRDFQLGDSLNKASIRYLGVLCSFYSNLQTVERNLSLETC